MTPRAINSAIAQACGWKQTQVSINEPDDDVSFTPPGLELDPWRDANVRYPDYVNSLDAMHEAEKFLTIEQAKAYTDTLWSIIKRESTSNTHWQLWHATAIQRGEAFVRTINVWIE